MLDLGPDPDMMKNSGHTRRERPYHHGDLYSSLVKAAEDLLEEKGANALSLREVCQCAGVSHAAPYRHFRDKAALMEAVAKAGFNQRPGNPGDSGRTLSIHSVSSKSGPDRSPGDIPHVQVQLWIYKT